MPDEIILIAAVTVDGYIARHDLEITAWSKDLPLFKEQTMGFPIIMGSNTFKTMERKLFYYIYCYTYYLRTLIF